jgi:hypothetical protein
MVGKWDLICDLTVSNVIMGVSWIGVRENLSRKPMVLQMKYGGVRFDISFNPTQ